MSKIVFTVSELNQSTQRLLEGTFPAIWVEGEISNLVKPVSGHLYFSLKDPKSQIRCALFRAQAQHIDFELRNGLLIQVQAKVSLYPDRGDYQLIVDKMIMAGDGLLKKAYEALVKKLSEEGLFSPHLKKAIPSFPKHIGVITSPTGAAVRDILSVLKRRFPLIPVSLYPTKVQGNDAMPEIVHAIEKANEQALAEVLILARGGGSLEDLWPFNEEAVARAIFKSKIPIVSGVGHEIDFTIADLVADYRAPTPSAAAELISPSQEVVLKQILSIQDQLVSAVNQHLQNQSQRLDWLLRRLRHPNQEIQRQKERLKALEVQLFNAIHQRIKEKYLRLDIFLRSLDAVSPLATLNRGYAILSKPNSEEVIRSVREVQSQEILAVRVKDGVFKVVVS